LGRIWRRNGRDRFGRVQTGDRFKVSANAPNKVDAVFEGGGVRGIGLVGAIAVVEAAGYVFENVAGTSAGAIVATLLAAGYSAAELKATIAGIDFRRITDRNAIGRIPLIGPIANVLGQLGIFEGDYLLQLMRDLLGRKGKRTFADFVIPESANEPQYRYKVQVVASDVTRGHMLVLPGDIRAYGMDPDALDVALAVRMSMSIPLFFRPVRLKSRLPGEGTSLIVDGGLLSDFPVELFDPPPGPLPHPIWGFRLVESTQPQIERFAIRGAISYLEAIIGTATSAHDARYVDTHNFVRSILIPTLGVSAVNFDLTSQDKDNLYQLGVQSATAFLSTWDLQKYLAVYRSGAPVPTRRDLSTP
jgi:NTE family protein